jgi:hypothetical protein
MTGTIFRSIPKGNGGDFNQCTLKSHFLTNVWLNSRDNSDSNDKSIRSMRRRKISIIQSWFLFVVLIIVLFSFSRIVSIRLSSYSYNSIVDLKVPTTTTAAPSTNNTDTNITTTFFSEEEDNIITQKATATKVASRNNTDTNMTTTSLFGGGEEEAAEVEASKNTQKVPAANVEFTNGTDTKSTTSFIAEDNNTLLKQKQEQQQQQQKQKQIHIVFSTGCSTSQNCKYTNLLKFYYHFRMKKNSYTCLFVCVFVYTTKSK